MIYTYSLSAHEGIINICKRTSNNMSSCHRRDNKGARHKIRPLEPVQRTKWWSKQNGINNYPKGKGALKRIWLSDTLVAAMKYKTRLLRNITACNMLESCHYAKTYYIMLHDFTVETTRWSSHDV